MNSSLADRAILVSGSPRSGTTWLAKILDSHPDTLYRHEPDELSPPTDNSSRLQLTEWIHTTGLRASKAPFFHKSWLPYPLGLVRTSLALGMKGAIQLPGCRRLESSLHVPDFVWIRRNPSIRPVVKTVNQNIERFLREIPTSRGLFIVRHPCGQVASTLQAIREGRFGTTAPSQILGATYAASQGVDEETFSVLSPAARWAWVWRAFNEPALARLRALPNAKIIRYEDLCADPTGVGLDVLKFVGLNWHGQTARFINRSCAGGRVATEAAQWWHHTMAHQEKSDVLGITGSQKWRK